MPVEEQGMKIFGHPDRPPRIRSQIPLIGDVQAAWLLLVHCAAVRETHSLRVSTQCGRRVRPPGGTTRTSWSV